LETDFHITECNLNINNNNNNNNKLTFDLLTLKVESESRVTWASSVSIFLCLSVLELGPMYAA